MRLHEAAPKLIILAGSRTYKGRARPRPVTDVPDFVVILLEVSVPAGSSLIQIPWGFPILKICMVGEDGEGVFSPPQVVPPMGKHFHHGKQLSFVNVVVMLRGSKGGRIVCDGVEFGFSFLVGRSIPF